MYMELSLILQHLVKSLKKFKESMRRLTGDKNEIDFQWSGDNTDGARVSAALQLLMQVENYEFAPGEKLYLVDHSHGGNVGKVFSNFYDYENSPELIIYNFATPNRPDYVADPRAVLYNIYNTRDIMTQDWFGGIDIDGYYNSATDWDIYGFNFAGNPSQTASEPNVINIPVTQENTDKYFKSYVNNIKNSQNPLETYINLINLEINLPIIIKNGQLDNHTEIKNPETVNEIYNYEANKYNEATKVLEEYENCNKFVNDRIDNYNKHRDGIENLKKVFDVINIFNK